MPLVAFNDMRTLAEREVGAANFDEVRCIPEPAELERCFAERLFFMRVDWRGAHARSSSSSKSCF